jgi:upstream activation factor subunit UAF30
MSTTKQTKKSETTTTAVSTAAPVSAAPVSVSASAPIEPETAKVNKIKTKTPKDKEAVASAAAPKEATKDKAAKTPKAPKVAVETAVAVAVETVPAPAAAAVSAKKRVPAVKKTAVETIPDVNVIISTTTAATVVAGDIPSISGDFTEFMAKLQQVSSLLTTLKSEFRGLEKKASRELKTANKASAKRKRKTGNRSPSGFVKPTLISNELAAFLGKTQGAEMARTDVTREINAYIRANKLQDTSNGRKINADTKLSSLLKLNQGDELTYFNLQRYMSPHFAKVSSGIVAAVVSA